jgi:alkylhydroperoxidase family enzyme
MEPMFLESVERGEAAGTYNQVIREMRRAGVPPPQIMHLFAFKPEITRHLSHYTQGVMRGPSPLSPGFRELIAAYTSKLNHCPF